MTDLLEPSADPAIVPTTVGELFLDASFEIGVSAAFGGVGPWARRIIVEEERWLDDREYAELLGLCQVLPGPNVGNVSVMHRRPIPWADRLDPGARRLDERSAARSLLVPGAALRLARERFRPFDGASAGWRQRRLACSWGRRSRWSNG